MKKIVILSFAVFAVIGCSRSGKKLDTPTSGEIRIATDESLFPIADAEVAAFEGTYRNANISLVGASEQDAVDLLLKDSVRMIIITRPLSEREKSLLGEQKIKANELVIATDGVSIIVHPDSKDSVITSDQLRKILSGEIIDYSNTREKDNGKALNVVFDHPASGIVRYLKDSLSLSGELPGNCFAVNNNRAVLERVASDKNALGLIGVSWISDRDDSLSNSFLKNIRVLAVSKDSGYFKPYQAYLATGDYPFVRKVYIISREARAGLASGFTAFVASDKGQRVVLKLGLVPATMPVRIVEINEQPLTNLER
jgi:phosphate transport system substrate-binding protein